MYKSAGKRCGGTLLPCLYRAGALCEAAAEERKGGNSPSSPGKGRAPLRRGQTRWLPAISFHTSKAAGGRGETLERRLPASRHLPLPHRGGVAAPSQPGGGGAGPGPRVVSPSPPSLRLTGHAVGLRARRPHPRPPGRHRFFCAVHRCRSRCRCRCRCRCPPPPPPRPHGGPAPPSGRRRGGVVCMVTAADGRAFRPIGSANGRRGWVLSWRAG